MTKDRVKELSYYLFFALMIFAKGIGLDSGNRFYYILSGAACVFVGIKVILTQYRMREIAAMVLLCAIAFAAYRNSGRLGIVLSVLTIIGLKGMDVRKLFRMGALVYGCSFAFTVVAAKFGVIGNPLVVHEKGGMELIRWGMGYSTGNIFHVSYFMLAVLFCYTWGRRYNQKRMLGLLAGNLLVFLYTLSYTWVLVTVFYLLLDYYAVKREAYCRAEGAKISAAERVLCQFPLPLCLLFSFGAPFLLEYPVMQKLNDMLQARLSYSAYYLQNQPITFLGTRMKDVPNFWVIMDNGYVYFFMTFGVAAFVLFCAGYAVVIWRYSGIGKWFAGEKFSLKRRPRCGWGRKRREGGYPEAGSDRRGLADPEGFGERLPELAMIFSFLLYGIMEQFLSNVFMNFSLLFLGEVLFGADGVRYGDEADGGREREDVRKEGCAYSREDGRKEEYVRDRGDVRKEEYARDRGDVRKEEYARVRGDVRNRGYARNGEDMRKGRRGRNGRNVRGAACGILGLAIFTAYYFAVPVKEYIRVSVGTLNYVDAQSIQIGVEGKEDGEIRRGSQGETQSGGKEGKENGEAQRENREDGKEGKDWLREQMKAYGRALEEPAVLGAALREAGVEDRLSEEELAAALEYSVPVSMQDGGRNDTFRVRLLKLYYDITEEEYKELLECMTAFVQEEGGRYSARSGVYGERIGKSSGDDRIEHMSKDKDYEVEKVGYIVKMEHFRDSVFFGVLGMAAAAVWGVSGRLLKAVKIRKEL